MLGHKAFPSRSGGVEVVVGELATRMAALGHEVTLYGRKPAGTDLPDEYEHRGVRVVQVPTLDVRGLAAVTSSFSAMRAALKEGPDVVHVHAEGPCAAIPLAKRAGVRVVATVHGLDWQRAKWGRLASAYIRRGERVAAEQADELIVLSRNLRRYFAQEYGREAAYIPNGVAPKERVAPAEIAARWGLSEGSYLLYLGRVVPEKRVPLLLEAFAALGTDRRLVVAGGPSDSRAHFDEVRRLAARDPRVVMAGFVEGRLLEELYSNACAFVLPSDLEGMPMGLLEAMAYGRACVTSDIPECAEVLGNSGATFRKGDAAGLRRALEGLLADPARARSLGEAARRRALSDFGWDSVVGRTLELYKGDGQ